MLIFSRNISTKCSLNRILSTKNLLVSLVYKGNFNFRTCSLDYDHKTNKSDNSSIESNNTKPDNQSTKHTEANTSNIIKAENAQSKAKVKAEKLRNLKFIQFKNNSSGSSWSPLKISSSLPSSISHSPNKTKNVHTSEQESAAVKLAKLIDKDEPDKTAEKLLKPLAKKTNSTRLTNEAINRQDGLKNHREDRKFNIDYSDDANSVSTHKITQKSKKIFNKKFKNILI